MLSEDDDIPSGYSECYNGITNPAKHGDLSRTETTTTGGQALAGPDVRICSTYITVSRDWQSKQENTLLR